jgi:hypothetical protein
MFASQRSPCRTPARAARFACSGLVLDPPALDDGHHISRVVAAVRGGQATQRFDGHLELPAGLAWPAASNNVLFVRAVYAPLFESVLNRCLPVAPGRRQALHRRVVTGQPGIGRSVWA